MRHSSSNRQFTESSQENRTSQSTSDPNPKPDLFETAQTQICIRNPEARRVHTSVCLGLWWILRESDRVSNARSQGDQKSSLEKI